MARPAHRAKALGAWLAAVVLGTALTGCGGATAPTPTFAPAPTASAPSSPAATAPTSPAATAPTTNSPTLSVIEECKARIGRAEHDQLGRKLSDDERNALQLLLQTEEGPVLGFLLTDGGHDFQCFGPLPNYCDPQYSECQLRIDMYGWPQRVAPRLDAQHPVVEGPSGGSSEGPYSFSWGAVSPAVSRIVVRVGNGDVWQETEAVIQNGYFMALINGGDTCCLTEYTAYDSSGAVISERKRN